MKNLIKRFFLTLGYKIERADNPNPLAKKIDRLIAEHYGCYRDLLFPALPPIDSQLSSLLDQLDGTQTSEAFYLLNALYDTKGVAGAICEFGVAQGFTSALIAHTIRETEKDFWLFDSFQGLPAPTVEDKLKNDIFNLKDIKAYQGTMKHGVESVTNNLRKVEFPEARTFIVDGFIEKTIVSRMLPKRVAFAYVDFDFYNPIKIALEFLNEVVQPGGIIMVDDYDFFSEGAKLAVDEFYSAHSTRYELVFPISSAGYFALLKRL